MTWSASARTPSVSPRAAKNWKVPTRIWLAATRVRTAPGSMVSRITFSPVMTAASERVVGMPMACIASLTMYSRRTGPSAARPSPRRENGVGPEPFSWMSRRTPSAVDDLAEQDGAAVAELGHEMAELVPGIGHRDRVGAIRQALSGKDFRPFRGLQQVGIEPEVNRKRPVQLDQPGRGDRGRRDAGEKVRRQRRIGVLEGEMDCHGLKIGARRE